MKIGKILAVAAVATVFASCSNEEELANVGASRNLMRFVLPEYQDCLTPVPRRLAQPTLRLQTLM